MESNPVTAPSPDALTLPIPLSTFLELANREEYDSVARTATSITIHSIADELGGPLSRAKGYAELVTSGRLSPSEALQMVIEAVDEAKAVLQRYHDHAGTAGFARRGNYPVLDIHPQADKEAAANQPEQG